MWRAFSIALLTLTAGCGDRALNLVLDAEAACTYDVPAGGSVSWDVYVEGVRLCGGCLAATSALSGVAAVDALLRSSGASCPGLHPGASVRVRVGAWQSAGCSMSNSACGESDAKKLPDGRQNDQLAVTLKCSGTNCNGQ